MPFADDGFGSRVVVESLDARRWALTRPLRYHGAQDTFTVPMGYITDFASVPRIAVWLIPTYGKWTRAAILHDWLITDALPTGMVSSVDVDGLFRRMLRELDVPPVKRWLMWAGVRWGAAFSERRRAGWWQTAPEVLGISVLALPLAVPMIGVAAGLAVYGVAEAIATGGRRRGTLST
jgi:hypothetical protein